MKKAGLIACSNGLPFERIQEIQELTEVLNRCGINTEISDNLYRKEKSICNMPAEDRAKWLMKLFSDERTDGIFDVSGGDVSIEILPYLEYSKIRNSEAVFWGYSDLTSFINAIYAKTSKESVLYQIRNLVGNEKEEQKKRFMKFLKEGSLAEQGLFDLSVKMLRGTQMKGTLIGGNIRCLLKLAGTEFWPGMEDGILFLECLHGTEGSLRAMISQLDLMGVFKQINGVLLGTFTEMEERKSSPSAEELFLEKLPKELPIAKTYEAGHGADSKALIIGRKARIRDHKIYWEERKGENHGKNI